MTSYGVSNQYVLAKNILFFCQCERNSSLMNKSHPERAIGTHFLISPLDPTGLHNVKTGGRTRKARNREEEHPVSKFVDEREWEREHTRYIAIVHTVAVNRHDFVSTLARAKIRVGKKRTEGEKKIDSEHYIRGEFWPNKNARGER